jgi:hypothetical protein
MCSVFTFRRLVVWFFRLWFSDLFPALLRAAVIKVLRSSSAVPGKRLWILSSVLLVGVFFSVPLQISLEMA